MSLQQDFSDAITALREKRPLVHCITNYVTAGDTANMLLAAGASPIMADDPAEAAEITAQADALLLNMGTLSERHISAMLKSGITANQKGIPVVLDPVGIQLSEFRRTAVRRIFRGEDIGGARKRLRAYVSWRLFRDRSSRRRLWRERRGDGACCRLRCSAEIQLRMLRNGCVRLHYRRR